MNKKQIKEEKLITEFIGKLASYMFMKKADDLVKATKNNGKLYNAFEKYKKDSEAFQARLKKLGITSSEDLVKAVNDDPNIKTRATTPEERGKKAKKIANQLRSLGVF
jgi:cell fate (sporulation/competence/biofilm development) regulator YlbF (YheA/YmcA/DUF963 family)